METLENNYLGENDNNTTGNIDNLCIHRESTGKKEYEKYVEKFNLNVIDDKHIESIVYTQPRSDARNNINEYKKSIMENLNPVNAIQSA